MMTYAFEKEQPETRGRNPLPRTKQELNDMADFKKINNVDNADQSEYI